MRVSTIQESESLYKNAKGTDTSECIKEVNKLLELHRDNSSNLETTYDICNKCLAEIKAIEKLHVLTDIELVRLSSIVASGCLNTIVTAINNETSTIRPYPTIHTIRQSQKILRLLWHLKKDEATAKRYSKLQYQVDFQFDTREGDDSWIGIIRSYYKRNPTFAYNISGIILIVVVAYLLQLIFSIF
ncbi:hypothetical protein [Labilibaculum euxinus]|uniref:Uncharacterized protein n=1 Tax=Labilibaculum euxinus TaxID=2686357 RepID=A0A7M4DAY1_9BACT|nr:hypothetical protein [Labilibaculum euxinus]MUP39810.1 hypothetical protein [Labilibaculum euxinus]MVB09015.1 hypothetical protein [Labilibaculum euxinus]